MNDTILFICTGNTCRSPLAEGFAKEEFQRRNLSLTAESAGLFPSPGGANEKSIGAAKEYGIDLSGHKTRPLTAEMAEGAVAVVTMTPEQAEMLREALPHMSKKIFPLTPEGISDPYGGSEETYRQCAKEIRDGVKAIAERIANGTEIG